MKFEKPNKPLGKSNKASKTYIYGRHALAEALMHAPRAVQKIFIAPTMDDPKLRDLVRRSRIPLSNLSDSPKDVESSASHQGVIALISPELLVQPYQKFAEGLVVGPDTALLLLDEVQDPHNVGAVIRSAAAFGLAGVLMPEHNQAPVTGAVVKVSAGMAFRVPLVTIGNVNQTIRDLKERGFWIYGLEGEGAGSVADEKFDAPTVFVLGNEGAGIHQKTKELCDVLISIPLNPQCESLNAAAATSVALYAWSLKHKKALTIPSRV